MDLLSIYLGLKQGSCLRPKTDVQSVDADSDFFFFFFFFKWSLSETADPGQ